MTKNDSPLLLNSSVVYQCFTLSIQFIPLACAECDDSMPFSEASSFPVCYRHFPATHHHQLFFHPPSLHLAIYFLVYLSILLFPNSYIIFFWEFYLCPRLYLFLSWLKSHQCWISISVICKMWKILIDIFFMHSWLMLEQYLYITIYCCY